MCKGVCRALNTSSESMRDYTETTMNSDLVKISMKKAVKQKIS